MSFRDLLERDMADVLAAADGGTDDVVVEGVTLHGFLDYPTEDLQPADARVATPVRAPRLLVQEKEVRDRLKRELKRGDVLTFPFLHMADMKVESVRPDGLGGALLVLKKAEVR